MNLPTLNRCPLPFKQPLDQLGMKGTNRLCTRALNYQELRIRSVVPGGGAAARRPIPTAAAGHSMFLSHGLEGAGAAAGGRGDGVCVCVWVGGWVGVGVCACMCTWVERRLSMRPSVSGVSVDCPGHFYLCAHMVLCL